MDEKIVFSDLSKFYASRCKIVERLEGYIEPPKPIGYVPLTPPPQSEEDEE